MRKKDVVLLATVTSFEGLPHPSRSELRQFAQLFSPLFAASSEEARRDAVAALSQCDNVPQAVAYFIASQPIAVAAPFLTASACLSDETLIAIARTQGEAHARAIVGREALSPTVIDALVGLRHDRTTRRGDAPGPEAPVRDRKTPEDAGREAREEEMRQRLKALAGHIGRAENDRLGLRNLSPIQEALLVRFARNRETGLFATVLSDTLSASRWLSERIMLDISGQQLAATLKGLEMKPQDALFVLQRLYDHLRNTQGGMTRAELLWNALDSEECGMRVDAWRRADGYTHAQPRQQADRSPPGQPASQGAIEGAIEGHDAQASRPVRTTASARRQGPYRLARAFPR